MQHATNVASQPSNFVRKPSNHSLRINVTAV